MNCLFPNYSRLPIKFVRGQGAWLWDQHDNRYLDALSGIAVCSLGHAHPAVTQTICQQAKTLLHTSNLYQISAQEKLAEKLSAITGMDAAFFCNSGTEANEAAIKLARLYAQQQQNSHPNIVVTQGAFHGRTLGALSASDLANNSSFAPLLPGFIRVPYNDLQAIQTVIQAQENVCAIMLEPIQGENGVQIPDASYLPALRQLCDDHKLLLILDEVQTGLGRTGQWYDFMHSACQPDILTSAKALGNGVPIGVCLATQSLAPLLKPGTHGSTFGGNPLACSTAITVLETIEKDNLCQQAADTGAYILSNLKAKLGSCSRVVEIRGRGMMLGIELSHPAKPLQASMLKSGLLINVTAEKVIRLLPPLILTMEQAESMVDILVNHISNWEPASS